MQVYYSPKEMDWLSFYRASTWCWGTVFTLDYLLESRNWLDLKHASPETIRSPQSTRVQWQKYIYEIRKAYQDHLDAVRLFTVPLALSAGGPTNVMETPTHGHVLSAHEFVVRTVQGFISEIDAYFLRDPLEDRPTEQRVAESFAEPETWEVLPTIVAHTIPDFDWQTMLDRLSYEHAYCLDWMLQRGKQVWSDNVPPPSGDEHVAEVRRETQIAKMKARGIEHGPLEGNAAELGCAIHPKREWRTDNAYRDYFDKKKERENPMFCILEYGGQHNEIWFATEERLTSARNRLDQYRERKENARKQNGTQAKRSGVRKSARKASLNA